MEDKKRMKLCPNCNGQVDVDFEICPYCGEEFGAVKGALPEETKKSDAIQTLSPEETIGSLYPPPYQPKSYQSAMKEDTVKEEVIQKPKESEKRDFFVPILFFSMGLSFALMSFFLLLFSKNGEFLMKLDSRLWIAYAIVAAPFIFFGYRKL